MRWWWFCLWLWPSKWMWFLFPSSRSHLVPLANTGTNSTHSQHNQHGLVDDQNANWDVAHMLGMLRKMSESVFRGVFKAVNAEGDHQRITMCITFREGNPHSEETPTTSEAATNPHSPPTTSSYSSIKSSSQCTCLRDVEGEHGRKKKTFHDPYVYMLHIIWYDMYTWAQQGKSDCPNDLQYLPATDLLYLLISCMD